MLPWTSGCRYLFEIVISSSSGVYPEVRLLDYMVVLFLTFWGTFILFSIMTVPFYIPQTEFPLSTSLPAFVTSFFFNGRYSNSVHNFLLPSPPLFMDCGSMLVCWAAVTKYHRPGGLNNSSVLSLLSQSFRGRKSKNKVSGGLVPSGDC